MKQNYDYYPDNWVIIHFVEPDSGEKVYKVLAGWSGGYLGSDNWRINSGIASVEDGGDYYDFVGHSGTVYRCRKNSETVRMNIAPILDQILANNTTARQIDAEQAIKEINK